MVTPFVPSRGRKSAPVEPGSVDDPADGGRLEAWQDNQRSSSTVSHRFEVFSASSDTGVTLSSGPLNPSAKFTIDTAAAYYNSPSPAPTAASTSPPGPGLSPVGLVRSPVAVQRLRHVRHS